MTEPGESEDRHRHCLVLIAASPQLARAARAIGCQLVLVQQPGAQPAELLWTYSNDCSLYTVDYTGPRFASFVNDILRPWRPAAVLAGSPAGADPAAAARSALGLPEQPPTWIGLPLAELTGSQPARSGR